MDWDPATYERFSAEREAPFADLLGLVRRRPGLRVIDLGCGTGVLTRQLADALPDSEVLGVDSSPEMLERASALTRPGLRFVQDRIEARASQVEGHPWDLVFSHAALHWVEDHPALLERLWGALAPGGQLAVQLPSSHRHPTYRLIGEIAAEDPFVEALGGWRRRSPVLSIGAYAECLDRLGGRELVVFEKVYPHRLADVDALIAWYRGAALLPYLARLPERLHGAFLERYRARLLALRSADVPGEPWFLPFQRTLFSAVRPD